MNYYWWRSNGESGQSGYAHGTSEEDIQKRIGKRLGEDIKVFQIEPRPKSNRFTGELYS